MLALEHAEDLVSEGLADPINALKVEHYFAKSLESEGSRVEIEEYPESDHFKISIDNGDANGRWATTVRQWMHELR